MASGRRIRRRREDKRRRSRGCRGLVAAILLLAVSGEPVFRASPALAQAAFPSTTQPFYVVGVSPQAGRVVVSQNGEIGVVDFDGVPKGILNQRPYAFGTIIGTKSYGLNSAGNVLVVHDLLAPTDPPRIIATVPLGGLHRVGGELWGDTTGENPGVFRIDPATGVASPIAFPGDVKPVAVRFATDDGRFVAVAYHGTTQRVFRVTGPVFEPLAAYDRFAIGLRSDGSVLVFEGALQVPGFENAPTVRLKRTDTGADLGLSPLIPFDSRIEAYNPFDHSILISRNGLDLRKISLDNPSLQFAPMASGAWFVSVGFAGRVTALVVSEYGSYRLLVTGADTRAPASTAPGSETTHRVAAPAAPHTGGEQPRGPAPSAPGASGDQTLPTTQTSFAPVRSIVDGANQTVISADPWLGLVEVRSLTGTVVASRTGLYGPFGLALYRGELFVSMAAGGNVTVMDPRTLETHRVLAQDAIWQPNDMVVLNGSLIVRGFISGQPANLVRIDPGNGVAVGLGVYIRSVLPILALPASDSILSYSRFGLERIRVEPTQAQLAATQPTMQVEFGNVALTPDGLRLVTETGSFDSTTLEPIGFAGSASGTLSATTSFDNRLVATVAGGDGSNLQRISARLPTGSSYWERQIGGLSERYPLLVEFIPGTNTLVVMKIGQLRPSVETFVIPPPSALGFIKLSAPTESSGVVPPVAPTTEEVPEPPSSGAPGSAPVLFVSPPSTDLSTSAGPTLVAESAVVVVAKAPSRVVAARRKAQARQRSTKTTRSRAGAVSRFARVSL